MSTFIIAEAGVNHNGNEKMAFQLVDAAAEAGADAVKFQTFKAEKVVRKDTAKAAYQIDATGTGSQFDMLKKLEMSEELHLRIADHCKQSGIEFMSTPFDIESARFLIDIGMGHLKIPSGELTNHVFIRELAKLDAKLILSTGMADLSEIGEALEVIRENLPTTTNLEDNTTILHCTSNYPTKPTDVNLRAMATIAEFSKVPVGYSDHTLGIAVCPAAVALGAVVLEKHFTLDRTLTGPDHKASLEPQELKSMVSQVRLIEQALGTAKKEPTSSEAEMRVLARRSVSAAQDLVAGSVLTESDLVLLRPANGILPKHYDQLIGRTILNDVVAGETLQWSDFGDDQV